MCPNHDRPSARELATCRPWLDAEAERIQPKITVCLGATAAKALLGNDYRVTKQHGKFTRHAALGEATATLHPSAILRRERLYKQFGTDLEKVRRRVAPAANRRKQNEGA